MAAAATAAAAKRRRRRMSWWREIALTMCLLSTVSSEENKTSSAPAAVGPKRAINLIQHFDGLSDEKSEEKPGNLSWGPPKCETDADCYGAKKFCEDNYCAECAKSSDCEGEDEGRECIINKYDRRKCVDISQPRPRGQCDMGKKCKSDSDCSGSAFPRCKGAKGRRGRCVACLESSPDCHRGQTCTWDGRCVFRKGCPQGMGEENCRDHRKFLLIGGDSRDGQNRTIQLIDMDEEIYHTGCLLRPLPFSFQPDFATLYEDKELIICSGVRGFCYFYRDFHWQTQKAKMAKRGRRGMAASLFDEGKALLVTGGGFLNPFSPKLSYLSQTEILRLDRERRTFEEGPRLPAGVKMAYHCQGQVNKTHTLLLGSKVWKNAAQAVFYDSTKNAFARQEVKGGGPRTLDDFQMQCGSIVNSARGAEMVTVDKNGNCWV